MPKYVVEYDEIVRYQFEVDAADDAQALIEATGLLQNDEAGGWEVDSGADIDSLRIVSRP